MQKLMSKKLAEFLVSRGKCKIVTVVVLLLRALVVAVAVRHIKHARLYMLTVCDIYIYRYFFLKAVFLQSITCAHCYKQDGFWAIQNPKIPKYKDVDLQFPSSSGFVTTNDDSGNSGFIGIIALTLTVIKLIFRTWRLPC